MAKKAMIWARVDEEMVKELDEIVAVSPGDRSDHIRQALAIYIKEQRKQTRFLLALATATSDDPMGVIPS